MSNIWTTRIFRVPRMSHIWKMSHIWMSHVARHGRELGILPILCHDVRHDSFKCEASSPYVRHDTCTRSTWLIFVFDTSYNFFCFWVSTPASHVSRHLCLWHNFISATWNMKESCLHLWHDFIFVKGSCSHVGNLLGYDSFVRVTWLIHTCSMT